MANILIVDDTPSEVALMKVVVDSLGHHAITAQNGKIGVQLAQQHQPDLVLLDIVMPEQDGFITCRQLKKNPETAHIPVILISSKGTDSDKFWGMKQGASDYVTKPFAPDQLAETIGRFLVHV
jgi:twitching motility two-component system response regulator PilH